MIDNDDEEEAAGKKVRRNRWRQHGQTKQNEFVNEYETER